MHSVIDLKTSASKYEPFAVDLTDQLTAYQVARLGRDSNRVDTGDGVKGTTSGVLWE